MAKQEIPFTDQELRTLAARIRRGEESPDVIDALTEAEVARMDQLTQEPTGAVRRAAGAFLSDINPVPMVKHLYDRAAEPSMIPGVPASWGAPAPEVAGRIVWDLLKAQGQQFGKAYDAAKQGRLSEAAGYGVAGMLPVVGPAAARVGETLGSGEQTPEAIGQALALALTLGLPKLTKFLPEKVNVPAPMTHPNPEVAAAVKAGVRNGIPISVGEATGSQFAKGLTEMAEHTPGGMVVARGRQAAQQAAMREQAGLLADRSFPQPIAPETAGQAAIRMTERTAKREAATANQAYTKLRELEAAPESGRLVSARTGQVELPGVTPAELSEVRRMLAELEEVQYTRRGMHETTGMGGTKEWTAGHRNAYVYEDIMNVAKDQGFVSKLPAAELRGRLEAVLNGEKPNVWFERALDVARRRLKGDRGVHEPLLPPEAGAAPIEMHGAMQAPIDLTSTKQLLAPIAQELEAQLAPIKNLPGGMRLAGADQQAAQTLLNVRRLMELPDLAPASAVDPLLSSLKAYVRGADSALARTRGQGIMARVIQELDANLKAGLAQLGPDAVELLQKGREATKGKYAALEAGKKLGDKAVPAYRKLVRAGDQNVEQLAQTLKREPTLQPVMGRAVLQELLDRAMAEGGWTHGARVRTEWLKLGKKTKALLFPDAGYRQALDHFFTLAGEVGQPFNTSKTALSLATSGATGGTLAAAALNPLAAFVSVLGEAGFVKAMHSPAFVKALTEGMRIPLRAGSHRAAAVNRAMTAARMAGVEAPIGAMPALAEQGEGSR